MSFVSLYYYLMVLRQMYINKATDESKLKVSPVMLGALTVLISGAIWVGVYPQPLVDAVRAATRAILPIG